MGLVKSKGNMYDFVSHMHSSLGGECPHKCSYCYVKKNRFGIPEKYKGELRLIEKELTVNYGKDKIIFIEHMNDMFADGVPTEFISKILSHCYKYPDNKYVFQTKNPFNAFTFISWMPVKEKMIIGTTIESNRDYLSEVNAPSKHGRFTGIRLFSDEGYENFITIEPVMDFDVEPFVKMIVDAKPTFINIGADSKGCNLPEPSKEKVLQLIQMLQDNKITIRKKSNLERILK